MEVAAAWSPLMEDLVEDLDRGVMAASEVVSMGDSPPGTASIPGTATQGYNDGFHQGKDDAAGGRSSDPNRDGRVRYSGNSVYRDAYLQGYAAGYGG